MTTIIPLHTAGYVTSLQTHTTSEIKPTIFTGETFILGPRFSDQSSQMLWKNFTLLRNHRIPQ